MPRYLPLFCLLFIISCKNNSSQPDSPPANKLPFSQQQTDWLTSDRSAIAGQYTPQGVVFAAGQMLTQPTAIADYWAQAPARTFDRFESTFSLKQDDTHYFEAGIYHAAETDAPPYAAVIGWIQQDGDWYRDIEIIYPDTYPQQRDRAPIDAARERWVDQSNALDHRYLVRNSYTPDAWYVNGGKVSQGTAEISERYSYMSRPNWTITLTAHYIEQVQDDLMYEIGQYRSGGVGHYIILWQRQAEGTWRVLLDYNF